ncbi:MAG: SURF1 family protein [Candidatus Nanopelagicaceae bacterium]
MSSKEPKAFLKTVVAIFLVSLCLLAANWQYQRGVARHANNFKIESNLTLPKVNLDSITDFKGNEWRSVTTSGFFDTNHDVLLRNRYNESGVYGYEYLTLFKSGNRQFWIDRGWVKAGANATERPKLPPTIKGEVLISGRIRLDSSLPRGSFFALPSSGNLVSKWNLQSKVKTESFYLDLIEGEGVTPNVPAQLPELSDGPHMAYALQWLFFAGLIIYGRVLIRKR